jgi:hypothetical protein
MNEKEIKLKSLELSVAALALLSQDDFNKRLANQEQAGKILTDLVILYSHGFEDYLTGKTN